MPPSCFHKQRIYISRHSNNRCRTTAANRAVVLGVEHRMGQALTTFLHKNCFVLYIRFVTLNGTTGQRAQSKLTTICMYTCRQQQWRTPQVNSGSDFTYKNVTAYIPHLILKLSILCHVIIMRWWTLSSPQGSICQTCILIVLRCPSWLFSGNSWCWFGMGRNCFTWLPPLPTYFNWDSLCIHFRSTSWCGLNECAFNAHWANAHPMDLCMWTPTKRIQCAFNAQWKCLVNRP